MDLRERADPSDLDAAMRSIGSAPIQHRALVAACRAVLRPLARLAVGGGLPFAQVAEVLKQCFVEAARDAHPGAAPHRAVSRISATTGLNRREVTRLIQNRERDLPARPSPATQVFTRWLSDPALRGSRRVPLALRLQGPAPSFESLAHSVTRDVHPRALLEELSRLGLARMDETDGRVHLLHSAFVPRTDLDRMLAFLGANVGDHLEAAVANVQADGSRHFEQALFADELSEQSLAKARAMVSAQWKALLHKLAPTLQALIDADRKAGRTADRRLRIGLYAYTSAMRSAPEDPRPAAPLPKEK